MKVLSILLCIAFASGFYIDKNETHEVKIIGGSDVEIEHVPYQASLLRSGTNNFCGATIIHHSWVITASHCVKNYEWWHILVQTGTGSREITGSVHRVEEIIPYDDYDFGSKDNDIALIKLAEPIQFNDKQQPIELAKPHHIPRTGELVRISGFGAAGFVRKPTLLKAAYIPVRDQQDCRRAYRPFRITDNMFCAGNGSADPSHGDSGGPGVINNTLHGVIGFGREYSSETYPAVLTRVHKYYDWIEETTGHRF